MSDEKKTPEREQPAPETIFDVGKGDPRQNGVKIMDEAPFPRSSPSGNTGNK